MYYRYIDTVHHKSEFCVEFVGAESVEIALDIHVRFVEEFTARGETK